MPDKLPYNKLKKPSTIKKKEELLEKASFVQAIIPAAVSALGTIGTLDTVKDVAGMVGDSAAKTPYTSTKPTGWSPQVMRPLPTAVQHPAPMNPSASINTGFQQPNMFKSAGFLNYMKALPGIMFRGTMAGIYDRLGPANWKNLAIGAGASLATGGDVAGGVFAPLLFGSHLNPYVNAAIPAGMNLSRNALERKLESWRAPREEEAQAIGVIPEHHYSPTRPPGLGWM